MRCGLPACGILTAAALALAHPWPASARTSQPTPTSMPTVNYTDAAFGFEMQVPAGWEYDRSRFQPFKDSIGLLRGRGPGGRQGLQILVFRIQLIVSGDHREDRPRVHLPSFEDWIVEFGKALAESAVALSGPERQAPASAASDSGKATVLEWEPWKLPPRAGAVLRYASQIGAVTAQNFTLCVPFDPSTVWVLVYSGVVAGADDQRRLRHEFDQIARTLRVHYDPGEVEQTAAAFERGRALLYKLRAQAANVRFDEAEYYYDISLAGKSIGYLRRRVSREEHVFSRPDARHRDAREGLRVRERSWRFAEDGTVRYTRLDMFSSFDGQNELLESQVTQIPAADVQPQQPLVKTDQVIRKDDVLFSSVTTSLDRTLPDPTKPLSVGPVYLDLAWARVLPGLLLSGPQEAHALVIYNTETRALISHLVTPLGRRRLEGYDGPAYAFEVREGLIDRPALVYTDQRGTLLRMAAGELVVRRASPEEVTRVWGARRDDAQKRFGLKDD